MSSRMIHTFRANGIFKLRVKKTTKQIKLHKTNRITDLNGTQN